MVVMLENHITSGGSCVAVPIISFYLCFLYLSYWDVQPPTTIQNVQIKNFPFDKLFVESPGLELTNTLTKESLMVKSELKIGLLRLSKVKHIINQHFCAYILIVHQGDILARKPGTSTTINTKL
jgi:hypothetical protein